MCQKLWLMSIHMVKIELFVNTQLCWSHNQWEMPGFKLYVIITIADKRGLRLHTCWNNDLNSRNKEIIQKRAHSRTKTFWTDCLSKVSMKHKSSLTDLSHLSTDYREVNEFPTHANGVNATTGGSNLLVLLHPVDQKLYCRRFEVDVAIESKNVSIVG